MNSEQQRFFEWSLRYPIINRFWNKERAELDIKALTENIGALSSGEQIILRFFASVWLKNGIPEPLKFDLVEAVKTLPASELEIVRQWLTDPFFP